VNIDKDLLTEIELFLEQGHRLIKLSNDDSSKILGKIIDSFVRDESYIWWWQSLKTPKTIIDYGGGLAWPLILNYFDETEMCYFVITDDEPAPWFVIEGAVKELGMMVSELWRFEYFIVDVSFKKIIFDNHHNQLVVSQV
jgi:hypothetical protein